MIIIIINNNNNNNNYYLISIAHGGNVGDAEVVGLRLGAVCNK